MRETCGTGPAGKDEICQRGQIGVVLLEQLFQALYLGFRYVLEPGNAQFAAKVEQVVLNSQQFLSGIVGQRFAQQDAQAGVEFIDIAERLNSRGILGDPRAVTQTGGAGVASAGKDLCQSIAHRNSRVF
jgi:hypothetical protein